MQEKVNVLNNKKYKLIQKYTWTEGKKNALRDTITQYGSNVLRNIEIPISIISCSSPQTKDEINTAYRRILELQLGVNYIVDAYNEESQSFIISFYEIDTPTFINKIIEQNIPFKKLNKQQITGENISEIIHKILDNRSIEATIDVTPGFITTKEVYIVAKITITNYEYTDDKTLKSTLYYDTKNIKMLITATDYNSTTSIAKIMVLIKTSQYEDMKKAFNQPNIKIKTIGATSMSKPEEQLEVEEFEKERQALQKSTIKIAKASFNIMNENKDEEEINIEKYKQMIYKTINTYGYYISEVTYENETKKYIHISIIMLQENAKIINSMMKKVRIEYTKYEE